MWIRKKELKALTDRIDLAADNAREAHEKLETLRRESEEAIIDLRNQVAELKKLDRRGSLKPEDPETVQIDSGHIPFSQRKRIFEQRSREAAKKPKG